LKERKKEREKKRKRERKKEKKKERLSTGVHGGEAHLAFMYDYTFIFVI